MPSHASKAAAQGEVALKQWCPTESPGPHPAPPLGQFETKSADVIGLYLDPPQHAVVFCIDEKTAIQALDRLDPVLPLWAGTVRPGATCRRRARPHIGATARGRDRISGAVQLLCSWSLS